MKITLLALIALACIPVASFAKDQIYLEPKTMLDRGDPTSGTFANSLTNATFTSDARYMAVSIMRSHITPEGFNMRNSGMLFDLVNGELVKTYKNGGLYIEGDDVLLTRYADIWDQYVPMNEVSEKIRAKDFFLVDPVTLTETDAYGRIAIPKGHNLMAVEEPYRLSYKADNQMVYVWRLEGDKLKRLHRINIIGARISSDLKYVSGVRHRGTDADFEIYELESGRQVNRIRLESTAAGTIHVITPDGRVIYVNNEYDSAAGVLKGELIARDIHTGKVVGRMGGIEGTNFFALSQDASQLILCEATRGVVSFVDIVTLGRRKSVNVARPGAKNDGGVVLPIGDSDNFLITGGSAGIFYIVNSESQSLQAQVFVDQQGDWAVVSPDGRIDGSSGAMDKLEWREYNARGQVVNTTSLSAVFANFFAPSLLPDILRGETSDSGDLMTQLAQAPTVAIVSPASGHTTDSGEVTVTMTANAEGDSVKSIDLYVNNKLIADDTRGVSVTSKGNQRTVTVALAPGKNVIAARAITNRNFESALTSIEVVNKQQALTSKLFLLAVGLDEYANPAYNLNYAVADAGAIVREVESRAADIFDAIDVTTIYNQVATREIVMDAFDSIKSKSGPDDVFVFFYAGHGVMSDADNDFYLALHKVTQLYGKHDLLASEGISAETLRDLTSAIPAQKQMILLDACQSGGAVQTFAMRGAAEEKAIIQLARSTGVTLLASTGSEQFATEFDELGHGVFTYAILAGLGGKADGGSRDKKITVKELEAYLNDQVPELTQLYKGSIQYPRSWSQGQDFPISVVGSE